MCPLTSEPQVLISHAPTPDTLGHRTPDPPEGLPGLCRVITSEPFWTAQKQSAGRLKRRQTGSTLTCPSPTGASESDRGGGGDSSFDSALRALHWVNAKCLLAI